MAQKQNRSTPAPARPARPLKVVEPTKTPGKDLRNYAANELAHAHRALKIRKFEDGGGIHEARKALRHVRAAFLLGGKGFRESSEDVDKKLRKLGRRLSPLRDAQVMIETLEYVFENEPSPFDSDLRGKARDALRRNRGVLLEKHFHSDPHLHHLKNEFRDARKRLADLPWKKIDAANIRRALDKSARQIRTAEDAARDSDDGPLRHAWRRRIRRLRHQLRAVASTSTDIVAGRSSDELSEQGDRLGREQDLRVLRETIGTLHSLSGDERGVLERHIERLIEKSMVGDPPQ